MKVLLPQQATQKRVNIVVLGADQAKYGHTDAIMVMTLDPATETAGVLSIPRDLWVTIPGSTQNRINQAYRLGELKDYPGGGGTLVKETLALNLGIPVDYYVLVNFEGFKKIVDALGGIEVCVQKTLNAALLQGYSPYFIDAENYYSMAIVPENLHEVLYGSPLTKTQVSTQTVEKKYLYIEAGIHTLDGVTALTYARNRDMVRSDFARVKQQQAVLLGLKNELLQFEVLAKIPDLWEAFSNAVETDLTLNEVMTLAQLALDIPSKNIQVTALGQDHTTAYTMQTGAEVLLPLRAEMKKLVDQMFAISSPSEAQTPAETQLMENLSQQVPAP